MNRYPDPNTIVDNLKKPSRPGCCDPYEPQDYISQLSKILERIIILNTSLVNYIIIIIKFTL